MLQDKSIFFAQVVARVQMRLSCLNVSKLSEPSSIIN